MTLNYLTRSDAGEVFNLTLAFQIRAVSQASPASPSRPPPSPLKSAPRAAGPAPLEFIITCFTAGLAPGKLLWKKGVLRNAPRLGRWKKGIIKTALKIASARRSNWNFGIHEYQKVFLSFPTISRWRPDVCFFQLEAHSWRMSSSVFKWVG